MQKYKNPSGIEWIGNIPEEWDYNKIKYLFSIVNGSTPESNNEAYWDGDITWITPADMMDFGQISGGERRISIKGYKSCGTTILPKNSIIISTRAPIGKINITTDELCTNQGCKSLVNKQLHTKYYYYLLISGQSELIRLGRGTTFIELGTLDLGNFTISFPPIPEQQSIAAFLDEKCSSVDSIIANMKKQVEILQQYTTSLITETVTKGLDKSAPMKNSGIEWIGKIPAHWEVKKIRYLGTLQNGITKDGGSFGSGFPFVSYSDVYNNTLLPSSVNGLVESTKNEQSLYSVKKDDAFFTRTSETIEEIGFSSVCESTIINATFAGFLIRFRPTSDELNMMFAKYYFRADILRSFFVKEMMIVTRSSLSQSLLNNLFVILPPLNEQKQIHDYIKDKCTRIDNIIAEKCQSIETIKAYKKSLIYEYVTGKKRVQGGKIK